MQRFGSFSKQAEHVWSHATFDFVLVMNAYQKLNLKKPFGYKTTRDLRTIVSLAGNKYDHKERADEQHNALADCIYQVGYCVEAYKKLTGTTQPKP